MKHLIFALIAACLILPAKAQDNNEATKMLAYIRNAMNFNRTTPQEKVYMHFDNTGYFENETLWFKAYVTRTCMPKAETDGTKPSIMPTDLSKILYVELLNPSGDVIKTTKWPIDSLGQAYGDMKLDTLYGSGFYEIRAYTRYMTNWGVNACFSRVFPVFKAFKEEGNYSDLTINTKLYKDRDANNRDRSDSLYLNAINAGISSTGLQKSISVQFFPEGGDLVKGKKSRVAMLAIDDNGSPLKGEGFVTNSNGEIVASVITDTLGRGTFDIFPDGNAMSFQMKNLKDKTQVFELPSAKSEGCVLNLDAVSEDMQATIQVSDGICGKLLGYAVMNNGNIVYCDTVYATPLIEIDLERSLMKDGVSQFTVFDSNGQILADRLFFIYPSTCAEDTIVFTNKTPRIKPCGEVRLEADALPNSTFSFTAIDAANMTNGTQGNIMTWMLLSSDVKGYIHNVDYYFEADDEEHRKAADLLMLTQGWRRYDWSLMVGKTKFEKIQPIEDQMYLFGKLNIYRKSNPVSEVDLQAFLFNSSGESLSGKTKTDKDGNYAFALPFIDGEWNLQIFTKIDDKRKTFRVGIDRQFSPVARFITPLESKIYPPLAPNLFKKNQNAEVEDDYEFIPITRKDIVLQNVVVKGKQRYFTNDNWRYKNESFGQKYASVFYDIDRELNNIQDNGEEVPTIFQFLCMKNALFRNPKATNLPTPKPNVRNGNTTNLVGGDTDSKPHVIDVDVWDGRLSYAGRPIKWIVNNGETHDKLTLTEDNTKEIKRILGLSQQSELKEFVTQTDMYDLVSSEAGCIGDEFFPYWMDEIRNMYIVPNHPSETDGAVRIYIYTHIKFTTESMKGLRKTYFQGFNKPSTFKMEDYSVLPPMEDFRRTIYWNPNVRTDANGKATVKFYNNSTCEEIYISAEGISNDGKVIINKNK